MFGTNVVASRDSEDGRVLFLKLDRPDKRNAMSCELVADLLEQLEAAETANCGAVVLAGAGSGFCAGSDLAMLAAMSEDQRMRFEADCGLLARRIVAHPLPILAAVHGFAMGGGLTLAAACDIVVTEGDCRWSLPEVPVGLFPAWGLEGVVARTGKPTAQRLAWGLDVIDGQGAHDWGLADLVVVDALERAVTIARELATLPRAQVRAVKSYFSLDYDVRRRDDHANRLFASAAVSEEAKLTFARFRSRD